MNDFLYQSVLIGNKAQRLIVFLHGYNSCIEDLLPSIGILEKELNNTLIIIPSADMTCERNPNKKQWYALNDVDPERKRRNPITSIDEIIDIYNKTGNRISNVSKRLNSFISGLQKQYKITNKNTYIMGFSQGAMLALYTGLTRRYEVGGVFSFAGIICGKDMLEKEISSTPKVYLFHGTSDLSVQYKTLEYTKDWLSSHDIDWESIEYDGIEHRLIDDEMFDTADFLK
ncbi:MAG: dienelactone hydrolase family protein [Alphaproteobacteria bacterium]|nr:dienelactone hydrolase family protein [Alphaproteobacteria bacterium]